LQLVNEMGRACSMHLSAQKCTQTFVQKGTTRARGRQEHNIKIHNTEMGFKDLEIIHQVQTRATGGLF
jgi:hypothetical protein